MGALSQHNTQLNQPKEGIKCKPTNACTHLGSKRQVFYCRCNQSFASIFADTGGLARVVVYLDASGNPVVGAMVQASTPGKFDLKERVSQVLMA